MGNLPVLETPRLVLRELERDDLQAFNEFANATFRSDVPPETHRPWLEWTVLGYEMAASLEQPHHGERAVVLRESGVLIGTVGVVPYRDVFDGVDALRPRPDGLATSEVGLFWAIHPDVQCQGLATEAARALMEHLFIEQRLARVIATTGYDNIASQRVMEKLGMTLQRLDPPRPPDQFVVGVRMNDLV